MRHHAYSDDATLARNLAAEVAKALQRRLATDGAASLVVAGGRTPAAFLRELGQQPVDWSRVHVTPADERCVAPDDPASNLRLVHDAFAGTPAASANVLDVDATRPDAVDRWSTAVSRMPRPFAAVVLGMGEDGHIASLFPGMRGLALALATTQGSSAAVVRGEAPVEPKSRLSLTLATLLDTDLLALHVTGPSKLATLQRASSPGSALEMPVRALLEQRRVELEIYHAP